MTPTFGVVILTMGNRSEELTRAIESVLAQRNVALDIVVVGNDWDPVGLPNGVRGLHLRENLGIPAGRNAGVPEVDGEFIFFLDDDSWLLSDSFLAEIAGMMHSDSSLGMVQPRIIDPDRPGDEPRRWIPRLRKGDPTTSSEVFSVLETAVVLRRDTYDATGGWPGEFFYAHEGIELAWRVWDTGKRVEYRGDLEVAHPVVARERHKELHYMNARNRVWLARRCLHWPFSWLYVISWTLQHLLRDLPTHATSVWWEGWLDGWTEPPWQGKRRRKLKWSTHFRMARHGRLPVV